MACAVLPSAPSSWGSSRCWPATTSCCPPTAPRSTPTPRPGRCPTPADEPFLETLTLLGFLAASTHTIKLGSTVIIVPYRNPIVQAKMLASLDVLSHGRLNCGVGVGWLE